MVFRHPKPRLGLGVFVVAREHVEPLFAAIPHPYIPPSVSIHGKKEDVDIFRRVARRHRTPI
jgi:hypothetical protein